MARIVAPSSSQATSSPAGLRRYSIRPPRGVSRPDVSLKRCPWALVSFILGRARLVRSVGARLVRFYRAGAHGVEGLARPGQEELNAAPSEYELVAMTVFRSTFGGSEAVAILEAEAESEP